MDFNDFDEFSSNNTNNNLNTNPVNETKYSSPANKSFDIATLIVSIIGGIAGYFCSGFIYNLIKDDLWSPLAVGITFTIFFAVTGLIVFAYSSFNGNQANSRNGAGKNLIFMIIALVLTLFIATLFEYIYEMNFSKEKYVYMEPTSYVFIIDNSSSMNGNDPDDQRYDAIEEIIANQDDDFPYAIYSFNDSLKCQREMAPKSDGLEEFKVNNNGGTYIKAALEKLLDEYQDDNVKEAGKAPKFLLLSDGEASDIASVNTSAVSNLLEDYRDNNITISTVGLGSADSVLMQEIADQTGGVFIDIDQADQLETAMSNAISQSSNSKYSRTFFTYRYVPAMNLLYAIMRIVFTAIIGFVISASMLFATGKDDDAKLIIVSSIITALLAGLLLELGINTFKMDNEIMVFIYMLLVALVFINKTIIRSNFNNNGGYKSMYDGYQRQDDRDIFNQNRVNSGDKDLRF
ncbi:vWA domain-containing protein [Thomasclavelia sp.]|uniref:VWA domain-containing protein n=1 Tax=Thomasclavelia sp. TaxID=3025757 RepID=UPI0025EBB0F5|nr:vWA domain-containing protein [Thomasclavelia sp.]